MAPIFVGGRRILGSLASDPTTGLAAGDQYYNTTDNKVKFYDGSDWQEIGGASGSSQDVLYDSVTLHMPGDGTTTEVSRYGHSLESSNASLTTGKFGNGIDLNATTGTAEYVKVNYADGINMGTADFTMEGWVYIRSTDTNINNNKRIFQQGSNTTTGYAFLYNDTTVYFGRTDEQLVSDPRSNWNDQWVHFAITRSTGTIRFFRNGTLVSSTTNSGSWNNNSTADLYFGVFPQDIASPRSNIIIDDIRFTKGNSRYTTSFNPPTAAFPQYKVTDLGTLSNPAINAQAIYNADSSASAGAYYINAGASGTIRTYCEFNSFGGWMLIAQGDGDNTSPIPTGTQEGVTKFCGGTKGRLADAVINNMTWNYIWMGMTDNDTDGTGWTNGRNTMDPGRQLFTTSGSKFTVAFNTQNSTLTSGSTDNGRNQVWSYKGIGGSSGSSLSGSPRQPTSAVINGAGSTDRTINNTNTYGIAPHDAGIGGAWVFAGNGTTGGGNFNNGFDQDFNNQSWTTRYSYWMVK